MAEALHEQAIGLLQRGDPKALDLLERATMAVQQEKGEIHADTAQAAYIFGMVAMNFEKMDAAVRGLQQSVRIRRAISGSRDSTTAIAIGSLANGLMKNNQYCEAETLFQECIDIAEALLGKVHTNTGFSYAALSRCLGLQGKNDEALKALETSLDIHEDVARKRALDFGHESVTETVVSDPDVLRTALAVANMMRDIGRDPAEVFDRFGGEEVLTEAVEEADTAKTRTSAPNQQMM
eukprot:GEMP01059744.1.p1 GENE.GEMP01059744.1~~GEMP01059744.1.p1  ORF type:complete len:237 (+),score=59.36 GEMP01059744.1:39-749(+)